MTAKQGKPKGKRMIKEIKRLQDLGMSKSQISRSLGICRNTVTKYLKTSGVAELGKTEFTAGWSGSINWADVKEKTNAGVKLSHYWEQNIRDGSGITYISFWREFKRRFPNIPIDLHKIFEPGLRCEFDYKGRDKEFGYIDSVSGEFVTCRLFGNILCFSQLFFARATHSEKQIDLFDALARSYEYFGGVPATTVFDNAKAQVVRADYFDADLNPEFSYFAEVYGSAPIATRPGCPKDKNLIENVLGVFYRWVIPQLKREKHYSLTELNESLRRYCDEFNERIQRKYGLSRREKFFKNEKEKLGPLPETPYFCGEWRRHKPHADCHIQYSYNFYSVPHECRGKEVDVRVSGKTIEIYQDLKRIAIHQLLSSGSRGRYITNKNHLPEKHQAMLEKSPAYIIEESSRVGSQTEQLVRRLIEEASHPLMYLRRCQGLLRFKKRYGNQRLEDACAFFIGVSLRDIKISSIEQVILAKRQHSEPKAVKRSQNENLRGQDHWAQTIH